VQCKALGGGHKNTYEGVVEKKPKAKQSVVLPLDSRNDYFDLPWKTGQKFKVAQTRHLNEPTTGLTS